MYCQNCGQNNPDGAAVCSACGASMNAGVGTPPPAPPAPPAAPPATPVTGTPDVPNHLVWAILATIFCCLPFGIVAIVYAAQVNGKLAGGDVAGAMASSRNAKMWSWIAFGIGLVGIVLWLGLGLIGAMAEGGY